MSALRADAAPGSLPGAAPRARRARVVAVFVATPRRAAAAPARVTLRRRERPVRRPLAAGRTRVLA